MQSEYRVDKALEAGVITYWPELMPNYDNGLIHVEYDFGRNGTVHYFRIWSSTLRGHWNLVCTYQAPSSSAANSGVHFENAYRLERMRHILNLIVQHQDAFSAAPNLGREGLLQISTPTPDQRSEATALIDKVCDHLDSSIRNPALV